MKSFDSLFLSLPLSHTLSLPSPPTPTHNLFSLYLPLLLFPPSATVLLPCRRRPSRSSKALSAIRALAKAAHSSRRAAKLYSSFSTFGLSPSPHLSFFSCPFLLLSLLGRCLCWKSSEALGSGVVPGC